MNLDACPYCDKYHYTAKQQTYLSEGPLNHTALHLGKIACLLEQVLEEIRNRIPQ